MDPPRVRYETYVETPGATDIGEEAEGTPADFQNAKG